MPKKKAKKSNKKNISNMNYTVNALLAMQNYSPTIKQSKSMAKDLRSIYLKIVDILKHMEDNDKLLLDGFKALLAYQKLLADDPILKLVMISEMTDKQLEVAKAIALESNLLKDITEKQDTSDLFGRS